MPARARIRLLTCDVDGVLTDGRIYVDDDGRETKAFSALDGVGINLLGRGGIAVAWITGSAAPAVAHRAQHSRRARRPRRADKLARGSGCARARLRADACAHIGDDLPDLPVLPPAASR